MALIYLVSALALGAALVRRVPFALYRFEAAAAALVLGLFAWTWLALAVALVLPYDLALPVVVTTSAVVTIALWGRRTHDRLALEGGRVAWAVWGVATTLVSALVVRLFWTHSLTRDADGIWSAGATWADFGLHASLVTHVAGASSLPTDLPVASGEQLTYPFLIDFLSGLYLHGGMSLHGSLFWPGVLLALAICQLVISVGLRLFASIWVGVLGLWLALACGSFAGARAAWDDWRDSGLGIGTFLRALPRDYSQDDETNAHLTNLLVDAILPQRSILLGLGVGLVVLSLLLVVRRTLDTRLLWPAAVLIGLLPMAHPHTFIVTVALYATLAFEALWRARSIPGAMSGRWGCAVLALPQLFWQQTANGDGTGGRFRLFWQLQEGESLLAYWWANFGLMGLAISWDRRPADPPGRRVLWLRLCWPCWRHAGLRLPAVRVRQPQADLLGLIVAGFFIAYLLVEAVRRHPRRWLRWCRSACS